MCGVGGGREGAILVGLGVPSKTLSRHATDNFGNANDYVWPKVASCSQLLPSHGSPLDNVKEVDTLLYHDVVAVRSPDGARSHSQHFRPHHSQAIHWLIPTALQSGTAGTGQSARRFLQDLWPPSHQELPDCSSDISVDLLQLEEAGKHRGQARERGRDEGARRRVEGVDGKQANNVNCSANTYQYVVSCSGDVTIRQVRFRYRRHGSVETFDARTHQILGIWGRARTYLMATHYHAVRILCSWNNIENRRQCSTRRGSSREAWSF